MSRKTLCLLLAGFFSLAIASAADKPNGNRLTYLDEPCNPYYVHRDFPKLTTPMWVGEPGVEAVVILGIDDMRGHEKWEAYLRPILNRLKQIDGRAPVSILTCTIDPKHPHLQQWLNEGLSLEIHTVDHPCPLLGGMKGKGVRDQGPGVSTPGTEKDATGMKLDRLGFAKDTYDRCVDLLNEVPNNKPVCFRMPCCDSLNTLSPRFFTEIFNKTTEKGNFLQADSSVFHVFTSDDPALPRELVLEAVDATGPQPTRLTPPVRQNTHRERFKKYIPIDRGFVNYIENYPYPYVIDRLCWEFPCVTPSDWSAQHLHKPHNPKTVEDWKAALDCTVIKQGVFCLVFHPHNWIKPEQINEIIDHAVTKHGKKVKFLTFKEAVERLNKNVLGGQSLRSDKGRDNGVRMLDVDDDGFLDAAIGNSSVQQTRVWSNQESHWLTTDFPAVLTESDVVHFTRFGAMSGVRGAMLFQPLLEKVWNFEHGQWRVQHEKHSVGTPFAFTNELLLPLDLLIRDIDHDGKPNLVVVAELGISVSGWSDKGWLPPTVVWKLSQGGLEERFASLDRMDVGVRFVDINEDGFEDLLVSNPNDYLVRLFDPTTRGWTREILSGKRGEKPAEQELPPIVRVNRKNNGFWVHSRQLVWMNEDTAKSKDLVERRTFEQLLAASRRLGTPARPDAQQDRDRNNAKSNDGTNATGKSAHPPDESPKSPEESLKLMQVKPGYRVELVAAEPLVRDPVAFDWGPDGKLWVAEMADYPLGIGEGDEADGEDAELPASGGRQSPESSSDGKQHGELGGLTSSARLLGRAGHKLGGGRVRILEDTDGDGKYDKSTVFLNKLNFPNGVMAWRDGVLISAAPDVLFARDTNGDGRSDEVKILLTGFGEGNQQHRVNGFSWGLDNMVHCANGDSGGSIKVVAALRDAKSESRSDSATIDIRGRDFRWNPDTGDVDPTSGQTQYGRNRDDFGNWFGNNNANPMYHFVLDDFYTRRNPHVAPPDPRKQVSINPGPSPVFPISRTLSRFNDFAMANRFTSANSAMVYRDDLLFERSRHAPRDEPKRDSTPKVENAPTSAERSARHAERDGYVAHVFISEPVHNLVHHEVMTADGVTFTSRRPDDEQQSEFLASRDNWFRPTQIKTGPDGALYIADMYRQVIEHPQYIPPAMQENLDLRAGHDKGRIYRVVLSDGWESPNFLWPLDKASDEGLVASLDESSGTKRDLAHRMLLWRHVGNPNDQIVGALRRIIREEILKPSEARGGLLIGATHASPLARLHALSLLDVFRSLTRDDLSKVLQDKHPAVRRQALHAIESFEGELPDPLINQLSAMGRDPDPFVRMQFADTLGHPKLASLGHELGKLLYRERDDRYLVAAAMSSIHAKNVASVVANVFESAGNEPLPPQLASTLLGLASTLGSDQALLSLIESVLSGAATSESQPVVLAQMLESLDRRGTSLSQLKDVSPQRLARVQQQFAERIDAARKQISNLKSQISNPPSDAALAALPLLGREPPRRAEDSQLIGTLLVPQAPVPLQTAAVTTLARINHVDAAAALLSGWRTFTPSLRTQVLDALLSRAAWTDKLLDEIAANRISPSDIDAARRQRLIAHSNEAIRTRAAKLLEVSANADRQKIVAEFAEKLKELKTAGDAANGVEVFKKRCATCHKMKDIGTSVGSDLVSLTDKSTAALLTAILDPNKAVEAKFLAYTAVNKQGQVFSGLIAAETGNSITLTAADGKQHTLLRAELDEFVSSNKSFMPEGLEKDVVPSELADIIVFVQSSGPPPKKFDGNTPEVVPPSADGSLRLAATNAEVYGRTLVFEPQFKNLGYWGSIDDRAVWTINISKPGQYNLRLNYACDNNTAGNELVITVADQRLNYKVTGTGSWENYQTCILGDLTLASGEHRLTAQAAASLKNHLLDWKELRLIPTP